jgi:hypothetical protein
VALQLSPSRRTTCPNADGGYLVQYRQRSIDDPTGPPQTVAVSADRVIVAAGSLGTSSLCCARASAASKARPPKGWAAQRQARLRLLAQRRPHRVPRRDKARQPDVRPVTTSFGQFRPDAPQASGFHNVEDQGVPRSSLR